MKVSGYIVEFFEFFSIHCGCDEQDGVCTRDNSLIDLSLVDDEIFSEAWDRGLTCYSGEVGEVSFEEIFIREDGHTAGSTVDVQLGLADWVEVRVDDTGGG